jgi:hypothetical protein
VGRGHKPRDCGRFAAKVGKERSTGKDVEAPGHRLFAVVVRGRMICEVACISCKSGSRWDTNSASSAELG